MVIFAIASAALVPLFVSGAKSATSAKLNTQAKNLAQERIEQMRNLAFHIDRQNGPFIDLLDLYYTNANAGSTMTLSNGGVGRYVTDASTQGGPAGAAYWVHFNSLASLGQPKFSQDVFTQFLRTTHTLATPLSTYDSQTVGLDQPPAQMVGVTVVTSWTSDAAHRYSTYTEIADGGRGTSLITTQARAVALRVTANANDGTTVVGVAGDTETNGSLTTGSTASVRGDSGWFEVLNGSSWSGASDSATAPPNAGGPTQTINPFKVGAYGDCGWGSLGRSQTEDISAATNGLPLAPSDVGTDATLSTAGTAKAGLLRSGTGCDGWDFWFSNNVAGTQVYDPNYQLRTDKPLVGILDSTGSSGVDGGVVASEAAVGGTADTAIPHFTSGKAVVKTAGVRILPTSFRDGGLVKVTVTSATLACKSNAAVNAAYSLAVDYPGGTATINVSSAGVSGTLPDPSTISFTDSNGTPRLLSEWLSWQLTTSVAQSSNGIWSLGPILRVTVPPEVVGNAPMTIEIGNLSCAASDNR